MLLAHPTIERLVLGVRGDVDQPWQYGAISPVDDPVRHPWIIASDKDDRAVGKGDVDIAAIDMAPGNLVPGDHPIGISDDGRSHSGLPSSIPGSEIRGSRGAFTGSQRRQTRARPGA